MHASPEILFITERLSIPFRPQYAELHADFLDVCGCNSALQAVSVSIFSSILCVLPCAAIDTIDTIVSVVPHNLHGPGYTNGTHIPFRKSSKRLCTSLNCVPQPQI